MKSTRWQNKFLNHFALLFFVFTLLNAVFAIAGPTRTTYQAKIVKPDGYPLEATSVNFKFTILDPSGSCILFAETYNSVNMSSTGGLISFSLGAGVKTFPVSGTTFEQIFSNITPNMACDTGGAPAVYTPMANDARKIVMQFHDGLGWQTLPAMNINAVPYAMYANDSQKFNGMAPSEFVQVSTIPICTASEALRYTGSAFQCVAAGGSGPVSSGSVITALGYTPADSANLTTVSTYASNVSATVFSVSSTVSSFQSSVAASFSAIVNSQWLTSGTAIGYDAGRVGIGTTNPAYNLHIMQPVSGPTSVTLDSFSGTPGIYFRKANGTAAAPQAVSNATALLEIAAFGHGQTAYLASSAAKMIMAADEDWTDATGAASIRFHTRPSSSTGASLERMRIDKSGNVGLGTVTPITKLDVSGGVRISMEAAACAVSFAGTLRYNSGLVEYCNGTAWTQFGVAGAGITAINGLVSGSQTFAIGNDGITPNISSLGSVHTFNFPYAASAGVTLGLISNTDYASFNNKLNATSAAVIAALAYTPANAVSVTTLSSTVASLASSTATSFSAITSSQWTTNGAAIYFNTGNVGIGVSAPARKLQVGLADNQDVIFGLYDGITSNFRFLNKYTDGFNYIQAGIDSADTAAKLKFSRMGTSNNLADVRFLSDLTSFNGLVGVGLTSATHRMHLYNNSTMGANWGAFVTSNAVLRIQEATGGGLYVDGNSILSEMPGLLSIGTLQGYPLSFGTSNTERMVIGSNGEVGIGVGSPSAALHIRAGTLSSAPLKFTSGSLNTAPQAGAMEYDGSNYYLTDNSGVRRNILWGSSSSPVVTNSTIQAVEFIATSATVSPYIYGSNAPGGNLRIEATTHATKGHILLGASGTTYVGIGVSAPLSPLHVVAGGNPAMGLEDDDDGIVIQNFQPTLTFRDSTVGDADDLRLRMNSTNLYFESSPDFFVSSPVTTPLMALTASGNLGIGTTSPNAKLDVNGVIRSSVGDGAFFVMRDSATSGAPTTDGTRWYYENNLFSTNEDGVVFEKTDANGAIPDGGFLFASRGTGNVRTPSLAIRGSGNIGIGTLAPTASLHIVNSGTSTRGLRIEATASVAGTYAEAQFASDAREYRIGVGSASETAHGVPGKYYIYDGASNTMRVVVDTLGNVGVGTSAPIARFDISRATTQGSQLALRNNGDSGFLTVPASGDGVILTTARYSGANWITSSTQAGAITVGEGIIQMFTNTGLTPGASFSYIERARVDNQGNFLVGSTNSAHGRLAVESSGTAYLSLNTTNVSHKRTGVLLRSNGSVQYEVGVDGGVNGTRDFYIWDGVSATARMTINAHGNIGIGTAAPISRLDVRGELTSRNDNANIGGSIAIVNGAKPAGTSQRWRIYNMGGTYENSLQFWSYDDISGSGCSGGLCSPRVVFLDNGNVGIGISNPTYLLQLGTDSAAKPGTNTWTIASDMRLKDSRAPFTRGINELLGLETIYFNYKKDNPLKLPSDKEYVGIRAQDVEKVIPEAVTKDEKGFLHFTSDAVFWTAVNAIKQLYHKVIGHDAQLEEQARRIASVEQENETLKLQNIEKEKQLNDIRAYLCAKDPKAPICQ